MMMYKYGSVDYIYNNITYITIYITQLEAHAYTYAHTVYMLYTYEYN